MGAKFIHPIASECPKKPVAIRNTTATMMRRSAGIISQNLSARYDMQRQIWERTFERVKLERANKYATLDFSIRRPYGAEFAASLPPHSSTQDKRARYFAEPSALLRRAFRRSAALR